MLRTQGLRVGYAGARGAVLSGLDLRVEPGNFVCVLGRNGAGKSTLMRTLSGLQPALAGHALLDGADIAGMGAAERARQIAVVLTERVGGPGLSVEDVVGFGRLPFTGWRGKLSAEDRRFVEDALQSTGAATFAGRLFDDLSDGERQRVMIARAIAQQPRLMLLDEITAFLDLPGRVEVMSLLRQRARQNDAIVLLSSHDLDLSLQLADAVWLLDGHSGLLVGTPEHLVAQGAIGRAFDTAEIVFSTRHGRFELVETPPTR